VEYPHVSGMVRDSIGLFKHRKIDGEYIMDSHNGPQKSTPYFRIWLIFFMYTAVVAALIQLIVLPYFFPAWHAGNGLLVGGDWLQFHKSAVELASQIKIHGCSVWQLKPEGQAPIGIAGAIYALTVPKPWTIIPLNAILQATSGIILLKIIQTFIHPWKKAILCVLPFILFPSALTWYTQIHKDGFFILGILFYMWGFLCLVNSTRTNSRSFINSLLFVMLGAAFVWIVRPYGVQMLQGVGLLLLLLLTPYYLIRITKECCTKKEMLKPLFSIFLVIIITPLAKHGGIADVKPAVSTPISLSSKPITIHQKSSMSNIAKTTEQHHESNSSFLPGFINPSEIDTRFLALSQYSLSYWQSSKILPTKIDSKIYTFAAVREGFLTGYPNATSNIDLDVRFHNVEDIVSYIPRATEIALFSPFPQHWLDRGSSDSNTVMRKISAAEMLITYVFLAFLVYALWLWSKRIEIWMILVFCFSMMIGFTMVIPNIGSLYRTRYGFMMLFIALGVAGFIKLIENRWNKSIER